MKQLLFLITFACITFAVTAQEHSVLSQGSWVKVSTEKAGVYQLTYQDLQEMGVDMANLSSDKINLYGMPAGALNDFYSPDFTVDLQKMAILVNDNGDGTFNQGDFLLFFGEGPVTWHYNENLNLFRHKLNPFCNQVYYFLRTDDESGAKRIQLSDFNNLTPTDTITRLTYNELHEKELYNPLNQGRSWMGELFKDTTERTFSINLPGYKIYDGSLYLNFATHATEASTFDVYVNNQLVKSIPTNKIPGMGYRAYFIQHDTIPLTNIDNSFDLKFVFNKPNDSAFAYLDYYELNLNTGLNVADPVKTTNIKSSQAYKEGVFYYQLSNLQDFNFVWDVTDPLNITAIKTVKDGDKQSFIDNRSNRNYYLFNYAPPGFAKPVKNNSKQMAYNLESNNLPQPQLLGKVTNQDVIGTEAPNMMIITNSKLTDAAKQLATLHQENDNISVEVYNIRNIYNEFSAGRIDPAAIRNFVAFKANQSGENNKLKYLLMFGSASFDYRGILFPVEEQVITYVSEESSNLVNTYHTDSYFANIGEPSNKYIAAVGRIPADNADEAESAVDKIEHYYTASFHDTWKNSATLIADNGDYGGHIPDQEIVSKTILENDFNMNQTKLYLSLFEGAEQNYPQVKEQLLDQLSNGTFFVSFSGHSSFDALTQEQIFTLDDAKALTNTDKLPVWINGGSSTAMFDVPGTRSLGMEMLLNSAGGAIAYAGNSGIAYASANAYILKGYATYFFDEKNRDKTIGDALLFVYSENPSNSQNSWILLGDPALKPVWPAYHVQTDFINGVDASLYIDTIKPGDTIKLKGKIVDADGNIVSSFTGRMRTTVYDMPYMKETIEGDLDPVRVVAIYDSILTSNCLDVVNGEFEGEVVPPAIYHEQFGNIKISYYSKAENSDATGNWNQLIYGGKPQAIDEETALDGFKVFPVPFNSSINLFIPQQTGTNNLNIALIDASGKQVYREQFKSASGRLTINLPGGLPNGIYFLNVNSDKGSKAFKVLKE